MNLTRTTPGLRIKLQGRHHHRQSHYESFHVCRRVCGGGRRVRDVCDRWPNL